MNFKLFTRDQFMIWFISFIVLAFFLAGVFDLLNNFIIKLVLFSCFSFVVANIYYVLFNDEQKKSPEEDSE
jgi:membrane protein implicated in regulation of membrane protease activity